ncbi:hypothetical protein OHT59_44305 [Streptomyces sp. NBC_00243]|uniref:hypothetical protein n=1 Tax=Streptomyces sp. NBC_00243 TaxID=2975688 RepID=UPI002DDAFC2B|nr:hypothetical protein [Streptomyces sp. NBC_00243]WRZ25056.1 hypothetical protein OHT59_44305 [Streptomyces sp. NBC_00243]
MARWIATREDRPSKEAETFVSWLAAAEKAPEFKEAVASVATDPGANERVMELLQSLLRQAGTHFGVGFSQGTREAVLWSAAQELRSDADASMDDAESTDRLMPPREG